MAKQKHRTQNAARSTRRHICIHHPDRVAAVDVHGRRLCWECHLGRIPFVARFGKAAETFYSPGGPGWAGD